MTDNVLLEVEKTFDFFKATASNDHIDRIVLSGGASRVEGFAEALHERFQHAGRALRSVPQVTFDAGRLGVVRRGNGAGRRGRGRPRAAPGGGPMIRVNLIAGERRAAKARGRSLEIGQKVTLAGTALLVVTALGVGWRYWSIWQAEAQRRHRHRRGEARRGAPRRGPQAGRRVRGAARRAAAARGAHRRTAARAERARCTWSTRSAARFPR